jgi:hypothetical protein
MLQIPSSPAQFRRVYSAGGGGDNGRMNRSHWPLRVAAAGAMLLCLACAFLAGMVKGMQVVFLAGQVLFGVAAFVLVVIFFVLALRKPAG